MIESQSSQESESQVGTYHVVKDGRAFCAINGSDFQRDFPLYSGDTLSVMAGSDGWAYGKLSYPPGAEHSISIRRQALHQLLSCGIMRKISTDKANS